MTDLSEQQERFCRLIIEGRSQREAYVEAGYKSASEAAVDANASRLISSDKIARRIADLRKPAVRKAQVTLEWLIEQAQEVLEAAKLDASHAAAVAAIKELGVLSGRRIETRHNLNQDANEPTDLTRAELTAIARAGRPRASAPGDGSGEPDRVH